MATTDRTRITKPSPIVEDEQGQLRARQGISREVVTELSKIKGEPDWMADKRLKSLEIFERKPIPTWGPDLGGLPGRPRHVLLERDRQLPHSHGHQLTTSFLPVVGLLPPYSDPERRAGHRLGRPGLAWPPRYNSYRSAQDCQANR